MVDTTEVTRTKREVSKRSFKQKDGTYTSRATIDTTGFRIEFVGSEAVIEQALSDFKPGVLAAAAAFGMVTSITNTFGGNKGPIEDAIESAEDRVTAFLEGDWSAERQGGARTSQVVEAFIQLRQDAGVETSDERKAQFIESLKAEGALKALQADPGFAAKLAHIKSQAAAAKAAELASKARGTTSSLLD